MGICHVVWLTDVQAITVAVDFSKICDFFASFYTFLYYIQQIINILHCCLYLVRNFTNERKCDRTHMGGGVTCLQQWSVISLLCYPCSFPSLSPSLFTFLLCSSLLHLPSLFHLRSPLLSLPLPRHLFIQYGCPISAGSFPREHDF